MLCLLFSSLFLHFLTSVNTDDCQHCWLAPDEPTLECTKTTNVILKFSIAFNLPLNQTVMWK